MYTIVIDKFENSKIHNCFVIDTSTNKLINTHLNLDMDNLLSIIIDYNRESNIHKIVAVFYDKLNKAYAKKERIIHWLYKIISF